MNDERELCSCSQKKGNLRSNIDIQSSIYLKTFKNINSFIFYHYYNPLGVSFHVGHLGSHCFSCIELPASWCVIKIENYAWTPRKD